MSEVLRNDQLLKMTEKYCPDDTGNQLKNADTPVEVGVDLPNGNGKSKYKPIDQSEASTTDIMPVTNLNADIAASEDKLFFIRFTPTNTLRPKWYLVQVELMKPDEDPLQPGTYFCTFFSEFSSNKVDSNM